MKRRQRAEQGMTLIEMVIGLTVMSSLVTLLFSYYWTGFSVWKQGVVDANLYESACIAMQMMVPEIRQGTQHRIKVNSGKQNEVCFYDSVRKEEISYERRLGQLWRKVDRYTLAGTKICLGQNPVISDVEDIRFDWKQERKAIGIRLKLRRENKVLEIENQVFCYNKDIE